jgi:hypothetical protein
VRLENGFEAYPKKLTGEDYLRQWKLNGGYEPVGRERTYENMPEVSEEKPKAS